MSSTIIKHYPASTDLLDGEAVTVGGVAVKRQRLEIAGTAPNGLAFTVRAGYVTAVTDYEARTDGSLRISGFVRSTGFAARSSHGVAFAHSASRYIPTPKLMNFVQARPA